MKTSVVQVLNLSIGFFLGWITFGFVADTGLSVIKQHADSVEHLWYGTTSEIFIPMGYDYSDEVSSFAQIKAREMLMDLPHPYTEEDVSEIVDHLKQEVKEKYGVEDFPISYVFYE